MSRRLRIAMIGCRGVPATYGGIERHVEEVGARLVDRGHEVTVYCRPGYTGSGRRTSHRGMRAVTLPAAGSKHLEALSHTGLSAVVAAARHHDVYHFHGVGPGMFTPVTRLAGRGVTLLTVHGLDYDRAKWSPRAKQLIRQAERVAVRAAHAVVIVAPDLAEHYADRYGVEADFISNGVTAPRTGAAGEPDGRYLLFVGRLTPEKGPDLLLEAFSRLENPDLRLLVVGGSSHTDGYVAALQRAAAADHRVSLRGYVYGEDLDALYAGTRLFVQPSELEGMPLTVLEAAAHGAPLLTSDIPVHRELLGESAPGRRTFRTGSVDDLERRLRSALAADEAAEREAAHDFGMGILQRYSWDDVVDRLEDRYLRTIAEVQSSRRRG